MTDNLLRIEQADGVATVTLNRPDAMNALSTALRGQLAAALHALNTNTAVRTIILTGEGRAFCAGLDLGELQTAGDDVAASGIIGQELLDALAALEKPLIAAVNGHAITGGLELVLWCDIVIASSKAQFADTHAKVGIVPAWGVTQRLPRIIGPMRAKEMSLTGSKVSAQQAYEWGLVNHVVAPEQLMAKASEIAGAIATGNSTAQKTIKQLIDLGWQTGMDEGQAKEQSESLAAFAAFAARQKR